MFSFVGNVMKRAFPSSSMERTSIEDVPPDNGFLFNDYYIPRELIILILSFVDKKSLVNNCPLVCKNWNETMDEVWKTKAEREYPKMLSLIYRRLPWEVYKSMVLKNPFNQNLLKNNDGREQFKYWKITENGGDKWAVENPPVGVLGIDETSQEIPEKAFVTSYHRCTKSQLINLVKEGLHPKILDNIKPNIMISEWYAARWDCNSIYELEVKLLNSNREMVDQFRFSKNLTGWVNGWEKVEHTFCSYEPGVRYILFKHTGTDSAFWAGHYGSKMSNAKVIVLLEDIQNKSIEESDCDTN